MSRQQPFGVQNAAEMARGKVRRVALNRIGGPALVFASTLVGFAAVARFSYQMVDSKSGLEALWLPNGVVVALLVLVPRRLRLWVALGMVPGELISDTLQGYPLHIAFAFALTDLGESALAALIILKIAGRLLRGDRQRDFYAILIAAALAPVPGGLVGGAISHLNWNVPFGDSFLLWWFGDLTGIFLVVSLAISLASPGRRTTHLHRLSGLLEAAVVVGFTAAVFGLTTDPVMFVVLLPVVGLALRHGLRVTSLASLAFAICATFLTASGYGPFTAFDDGPTRVMLAQGFITITAAIAFLVSATMAAQRRAEDELVESLAELVKSRALERAVVEGTGDVLAVVELDWTIRLVSPAVEDELGYAVEELVGASLLTFIHPDDQAAVRSLAAGLAGRRPGRMRCRVLAKDGRVRLWDGTVAAEACVGRPPSFRVVNLRDVTDEASREEQLRQAQKLETVGRLAGGVAHDFNNLLVGILGYNELALAKIGDGPGATEISGALAAARDAASLTAQLLAHSRRQVLDPHVFDLRAVVSETTDLLRRMIDSRIEITVTLPEREVLIVADRPQIGQVLMNLAVNSGDAMTAGGHLRIGLASTLERARLTVQDDGAGMDAETIAQIYEPFFTTKGELGTGLGLSTVHGIVAQSGGQILVESEPGSGTTFTVVLPLGKDDRRPAATVTVAVPRNATHGHERILFVDDEPTVRDVVATMLGQRGYSVSVAASGAEAVALSQATRSGTIDLVLTDLAMVGMDGRETAEAIRVHQPATKTLYISGYTEDSAIRIGGYEPGVGFLQKPFTADELDSKIRVLLDPIVI